MSPAESATPRLPSADLPVRMLQAVLRRRRPRRVLLLGAHGVLPDDFEWPPAAFVVRLCFGDELSDGALRCRGEALPFQGGCFDVVVLMHLLRNGEESSLGEAARVLAPGGELLILGLNAWGWAAHFVNPGRLPALSPAALTTGLRRCSLVRERTEGAGLCGRQRRVEAWPGANTLLRGVKDIHLVHCRHESGSPGVTVMRFSRPRGVPGRSAVAGGFNGGWNRDMCA
ncbi:MAG: methyltransferase domain-containing protein [Xanthomonadales bacterium]|nr:methyltransferase domain-containing protein [Xanthomonadales bacterium]